MIHPNKSFLLQRYLNASGLLLIAIIGLITGSFFINIWFLLPIVILFFAYLLINITVQFKKEQYQLEATQIVRQSGGLFSDNTTTLQYKNITQILHIKPFFYHHLFGVSHIMVESAGSAGQEVTFWHINDGDKRYTQLQELMRQNGFSLNLSKKSSQKPSTIGIGLQLFQQVFSSLIALVFLFQPLLIIPPSFLPLAIVGIILLALFFFVRVLFSFLDMKMRVYTVTPDTFVYYEGFLTKIQAIIPKETTTDISIDQNFFGKLFGYSTVDVSCRGSNQKITFSHVLKPENFEKKITKTVETMEKTAPKVTAKKQTTTNLDQKSYKMHAPRVFVPLAFYALFAFFLFIIPTAAPWALVLGLYVITHAIEYFAITYHVKKQSITSHFEFINTKKVTFECNQITSIEKRTNPLDFIFGTYTVLLYTVGSSTQLKLKNIIDETLFTQLQEQLYPVEKSTKVKSSMTIPAILGDGFISYLLLVIVGIIASFFFIYAGILIAIVFASQILFTYLKYKSAVFTYSNILSYSYGFFIRREIYTHVNDVKNCMVTKNPISHYSVDFDIAAETTNDKSTSLSHKIQVRFVQSPVKLLGIIVEQSPTQISTRPNLFAASLAYLWSVIFIIPLFFYPLYLFWYQQISYKVTRTYVAKSFGYIYKRTKYVPLEKVDYVQVDQRLVGKMTNTKGIFVHTTGSSLIELYLAHLKDAESIKKLVK